MDQCIKSDLDRQYTPHRGSHYEKDAYQIACQLDVTLQVIQDYRAFLNGHCGTPLFTNSH